ncbi:MAG: YaaC family protein [Planctomycetota bacterium]|nr:YaaC family protein [Planctomycetota bacterium]
MPTYKPLVLNNRDLSLPKAIVAPELGARTVLTNEPWDFVELALVRQKKTDAQFYWQQAREFYTVAQGLPVQSAPLLLYYAFMNATKALLSAKGIAFDPMHGVGEWKPTAGAKTKGLAAGVKIKTKGILPSLASYYGETEPANQHLLKDILFNLPYIHRTYCLTYTSQSEMFVPIVKPLFVVEQGTKNVYFSAQLSAHYTAARFTNRLPATFTANNGALLSSSSVAVTSTRKPTATDMTTLATFAKSFRDDLFYINGAQTLWYVKATVTGKNRLLRQSTTLTLAAMHRLSEVCRYAPMELAKYLEGQKNWLLSEFIRMSGTQFIDEIASEITGKNFLVPNVRPAN